MAGGEMDRRAFAGLVAAAGLGLVRPGLAQSALSVAAVNYPLAYFAERIAGDLAQVSFPVPPDTDPSFWRPSIAEISAIQSADLILLNGASFADWVARTSLPRARTVITSSAFEEDYIATETVTHSHGDGGEHSHTGTASYTWLDFAQARQQADIIAAAMTRRASGAEETIAANLAALVADLEALDADALDIGIAAQGVPIIASHPRYQYLARAYGLTMEAVAWDATAPASEAEWEALGDLATTTGARIFLWEAAPSAEALARIEALGLTNAVFPPLANRPADGDFVGQMQASLANLRQAIQAATGG